nr:HNH endonuclease [Natronosalvus rutilus]
MLERDEYRCQSCGRGRQEIGRNPDVHHVIPVRTFDDPEDAHTLDNVVSLFRRCHRLAEEGSIAISPDGKR